MIFAPLKFYHQIRSMNKVIRTGICSFGMSGKVFHAPFIQHHPGFELVAIVERHRDESRALYPASRLVRSFEELIADDSIRLIVVNTPVQTHLEYVKAALLAGKDVVVEKPFTVTAAEAEELERVAKETGRFLAVYQNRRYDGDFRAVKEVVEQALLGELREVEIRYDRYRTGFSGKAHKEAAIPGAGMLHDLGAHLLDQCLQLFGWPEKIFADLREVREHNNGANDYFELLLFYPALRVRLKASIIAKARYPGFILHGLNGSFLQDRSDTQEELLIAGTVPTLEPWTPAPKLPDGWIDTTVDGVELKEHRSSGPGNYMDFYEEVYKSLTGGTPNPVPASDAVKTMKLIDAALLSDEQERVIAV